MKVKGNFLGARRLAKGERTGMIKFAEDVNKYYLADLEGEVILSKVEPKVETGMSDYERGYRDCAEKLMDILERDLGEIVVQETVAKGTTVE